MLTALMTSVCDSGGGISSAAALEPPLVWYVLTVQSVLARAVVLPACLVSDQCRQLSISVAEVNSKCSIMGKLVLCGSELNLVYALD
jgi:hypothetical protein